MSHAHEVDPAALTRSQAAATGGRFDGKVALVTGSSDKGIGAAIAERLSSEGAAVALVSRTEPKRLLKRLAKFKQGVIWTSCDITRPHDVTRAIDQCMENYGQIDVLVNNAGLEVARPLEQFRDDEWQGLLDVNLSGAVRMTHAALPYLTSPDGAIVNVASALALGGCPSFSIYSASKAGLIGLTQSLAWELAPRGIRVTCVAPALVHTPMIHKHIEHLTPAARRQIEASHPLGVGMPHDVANAVAFLASHEARWITGITLPLGWASGFPLPVEHFMKSEPRANNS